MISELSNSFGVSGCEEEIKEIITSILNEFNIDFYCDKIGNIIVPRYTNTKYPTIMIGCGIDEKGLIVTDITDDGYLKFDTIGDVDIKTLVSKKVKSNDVSGIISLKAVHLLSKEEREHEINIDNLCIDIGATCKKDAMKYVTVGDYFSFDVKYNNLGTSQIKGKALGRSISINILLNTIKYIEPENLNILYVFTVQNEIYARGMKTLLNNIGKIDLSVILDSVDVSGNGKVSFEKGPIICLSNNDTSMTKKIIRDIDCYDIQHQNEYITNFIAADLFKNYRADIPTVTLGIPCGHKCATVNNVYKKDIDNTERFIRRIAEEAKNLVKQ